jgi:hypothetical protein
MAEITLADYTGYIFLELIRAREMADRHSRELAAVYARDAVLQHFSVPRFKVPKMELTIPVLISGARFSQVLAFRMPRDRFVAFVNGRMADVISTVRSTRVGPVVRPPIIRPPIVIGRTPATDSRITASSSDATGRAKSQAPSSADLVTQFFDALTGNPDPSQPGTIVREYWSTIFEQALTEQNVLDDYKRAYPNDEPFRQSLDDVLKTVTTSTVVDSTAIQSLLINPETNVVKNGSSDTSVFTIRADMVEEGFFIRQVRDETTGETRPIVEFE